METKDSNNLPLRCEVVEDALTIRIGKDTLAFAFENGPSNLKYDESTCDYVAEFRICDPHEFCADVCREMNRESEDGSTPLTRFLVEMAWEAVGNGSLGVEDKEID